jgi:hypothetical protein
MKVELPEIGPEERTPLVERLLEIIREVLDRVAELESDRQLLRDENAKLKGQKARPVLRPSTLEKSPPPKDPLGKGRRRGQPRGPRHDKLVIHHTEPVHPTHLPDGAKFRQFEPFVVQDLEIGSRNTRYERARYDLPGGGSVLAPLPAGVVPVEGGHFGAKLVTYILSQHYQAHVTQPVLLEQLREYGVVISTGQLQHILTEHKDRFHQEKAEVLVAGLETASYIGADDTGARHRGQNGYTTAIGNDLFAYFETTDSKSRLNFLQLLHGGQPCYAVNDTALAYYDEHELAAAVLDQLRQEPGEFGSAATWEAHLAGLGITKDLHVRIATEGALLGGLIERGVSPELVVLSDGALQFVILWHAACWIHAERPLLKMVPHHEAHRAVIETIRGQIWELYRDLKAFQENPDAAQRPRLEARFDALVGQRRGYPNVDQVLKSMRAHKADLLRVLQRPEIPLHNNGRESDIRDFVKRRKISGGTRSDAGRRCRDTFASLKKTCRKLGIRFWEYLQDRVAGRGQIPRLAEVIRHKAQEAARQPWAAANAPGAAEAATKAVAVPV